MISEIYQRKTTVDTLCSPIKRAVSIGGGCPDCQNHFGKMQSMSLSLSCFHYRLYGYVCVMLHDACSESQRTASLR